MSLCNCDHCYCHRAPSGGRKSGLCLACEYGEHEQWGPNPNRIRICRSCRHESVSIDVWPERCFSCQAPFGPIALGFDRVNREESGKPMTTASDFVRAIKQGRKASRASKVPQVRASTQGLRPGDLG